MGKRLGRRPARAAPWEDDAWEEDGEAAEGEAAEDQQHVWAMQAQLTPEERDELEMLMDTFHREGLAAGFREAMERRASIEQDLLRYRPPHELCWSLKFPPKVLEGASLSRLNDVPAERIAAWRTTGMELLEMGQVGIVLLAGGDGSRLSGGSRKDCFGFSPPTPVMDVGLLSRKSIFQIYAERVKRLHHIVRRRRVLIIFEAIAEDARLARRRGYVNASGSPVIPKSNPIPVYVMTSQENRQEIESFWYGNKYFGLRKMDVYFFCQESHPVFSRQGKILMSSPSRFILRPGGSGGLYRALHTSGALADARERDLAYLFATSCDNLLARIGDPTFIGHCQSVSSTECDGRRAMPISFAMKTVERVGRDERLGLLATRRPAKKVTAARDEDDERFNGRPMVLECYEVPEPLRSRTDKDLLHFEFSAGDICQYVIRMDSTFDHVTASGTGWHAIPVRMPAFSMKRARVLTPPSDMRNAVRLERVASGFVQHQHRAIGLHVDRDAEFAPIRAQEDLAPAVQLLGVLHQSWIRVAGGVFHNRRVANSRRDSRCEVSPLVSFAGEDLAGFRNPIDLPYVLESAVEASGAGDAQGFDREFAKPIRHALDQRALELCKFVPWDSGSVLSLPAGGIMGEEERALAHDDGGFVERAAPPELLPLTPRWLKDEEDNWELEVAEKQRRLRRMLDLERLQKRERRDLSAEELEQLLSQQERAERSSKENARKERRPRTRTLPHRPDVDEEDGRAVVYGTARYRVENIEESEGSSQDPSPVAQSSPLAQSSPVAQSSGT